MSKKKRPVAASYLELVAAGIKSVQGSSHVYVPPQPGDADYTDPEKETVEIDGEQVLVEDIGFRMVVEDGGPNFDFAGGYENWLKQFSGLEKPDKKK